MKEELLPKEYKDMVFSMSEFQIKHFVVNSQHNPYRQFKQILLELEVRYTNAEQINLEVEKNRLELLCTITRRQKSDIVRESLFELYKLKYPECLS